MIHYDPHRWLDHFFDARGSLVREIIGRVAGSVLWALLIVVVHKNWVPLGMSSLLHSLIGVALGLLLVFRTNASYDRYWEGRKLWGGIVNESRNLIRSASAILPNEPMLLQRLTKWTAVFPWTAMNVLRSSPKYGSAFDALTSEEHQETLTSQHPALTVSLRMTEALNAAREQGKISDILHATLDQNIQLLVGYLGGCERIRKTPLPFAYIVHLRRALVLYCLSLPFALVDSFGWGTVFGVAFIAYVFFGIEEIGVEIEGPFGYDENDLPLEDICETIQKNVYALADMGASPQEAMPEGL